MKKLPLPSYKEIDQALSKVASKPHPSQVHGLICGLLCGNPKQPEAWETLVIGSEKTNSKMHALLQKLHEASAKQLDEFLFELQLLLPDDDLALPIRAEALTLWCQGFVTGLKLSQVPIIDREPSETTEAINDLIEIAKMKYENVVASEEDEAAYLELMEYVRIAVILIYQNLREVTTSKKSVSSSKHLH